MLTKFAAAACILALLVSPCAAQADRAPPDKAQTDKALNLVPEDALGFLLIKDLRSLSDKVNDAAQRLDVPEKVSLLELIQKELGIHEGINANGSVLFLV